MMEIVVAVCANLKIASMLKLDLWDFLIFIDVVFKGLIALVIRYRIYDHGRMFIVFHSIFMI